MQLSSNKVLSFILNCILDILFTLVLLFSIGMAILCLSTHTSFFGYRLGIVSSSSMEASGYEVGEVVFLERQKNYNIGDVIAFYRAPSLYDDEDVDKEQLKNTPIWIHEIIDIKVDEDGNNMYLTKGSSNTYDDTYYVPEDFVVGLGVKLNPALSSTLAFVVSRTGIICLIIVPCIIMLIYLTWELIMIITSEPDPKKVKYKGKLYNNKPVTTAKLQPQRRIIYIKVIPYNKYNLKMPDFKNRVNINVVLKRKEVRK